MIPIAERGRARCVIVRQPGATPAERYAAEELASTLQKITGAEFEIKDTETAPSESAIIIGLGPVASVLFPEVRPDALGAEQAIIRTKKNYLLLTGGRTRGTLYAVYRFLQDQCGVRWWTPWATTIPKKATLSVNDNFTMDAEPGFESRDPFWFSAFDGDWAARNFANGQTAHLTEKHGGKILYKGFVHTFYALVPPEKHFAVHPEWYSLLNGKRTVEGGQLCTTNPALREFVVGRVREWLKEAPEAEIVSISQNDWYGACQCPNCKAIDEREGSHSGTMLTFVNYIASQLGREFPHVAFDTLAYQYTRKAPKTVVPLPNVIVRLCSIECNFAAPLEDVSNKAFADDLRAWGQKSKRLYIWDYTTNFAHYPLPHANWYTLGRNVRFFQQHGARGLFEQGAYQSHGGEMAELRAWVLARLLWNPQLDDRKLINEFLDGYYGKPAAHYIRQYMDLLHQKAKGFYLTCYNSPGAPYLDYPTLSKAEQLWQQAENAAKNDPDLLWRVKQGHLPVRYAFLQRWQALRRDSLRVGAAKWTLPTSRKTVADEWLAIATGSGPSGWTPMTLINEGGTTPAVFVARFAQDPPEPAFAVLPKRTTALSAPTDISGIAPGVGVDGQDNLARLFNEGEFAETRADAVASDGIAVWMPGNHHEWAFQIPVAKLPIRAQSGKWDVYAVIRVEKADNMSNLSPAFTAGVYDVVANKGAAATSVSFADVATSYKSYHLGTVATNKDQYLWVAPAANADIKAVWVDRIYLVPAK